MNKAHLFILFLCAGVTAQVPASFSPRGVGGGGALFSPSINPANDNEYYVSCDMSQIFHTSNFGRSYDQINFQQAAGGQFNIVRFTSGATRYCLSSHGDIVLPMKSTDNGATWSDLAGTPLTDESAYYLYVDYNQPLRILLSYYGEIYFSRDGGTSFTPVHAAADNNTGVTVGGVFFSGDTIYAGTNDGLLVSRNGGQTFSIVSASGITAGEAIWSMAGAQSADTVRLYALTGLTADIYAGLWGGDYWGFFKNVYTLTIINGTAGTWQARSTGLTAATDFPMFVSMAGNDINTCYLAGSDDNGYPTVYKTTNAGGSWTQRFQASGNANIVTGWSGQGGDRGWGYGECALGFAVSPSNKNRIVITDYGYIHVSTDGGTSWRQAYVDSSGEHPAGTNTPLRASYKSIGLENTTCWQVLWTDPKNMFACFSDIKGIRSADSGATWSFNYTGLNANTTYRMVRHANGTLYAATSNIHDMYQSTRLQDAVISASDAEGKVIFSADTGRTWQTMHLFSHPVFWVALDPTNANRMYASVIDSNIGGIYVSGNIQNGASSAWTKLSDPPRTENHPASIVVLNDGQVVCTYSGRRTAAGAFTASSGCFIYNPSNTSWTDVSHSGMYYWTKDIVVDPYDAAQNTWYVCVFSGWGGAPNGLGGLYRTTNRGANWTKINDLDRVSSCTFNPNNRDILYLTTEQNGLWYSANISGATPSFSLVSSYPFRQPERVFCNPYKPDEMWVSSFGNGMKAGTVTGVGVVFKNLPVQKKEAITIKQFTGGILSFPKGQKIRSFAVYDSRGRRIFFRENLATNTVDLRSIPSGAYYGRIVTENGMFRQKLVIEK